MIIQVRHKQLFGKGAYGLYFKLKPSVGVKIIVKSYRKTPEEIASELDSYDLNKVVQEATIGKIFDNNFTKRLCIVKYNKRFYLGIMMKHEKSITAKKFTDKLMFPEVFVSDQNKITLSVKDLDTKRKNKSLHFWKKQELWKKKIICTDENRDNILVKKDQSLTIVDFDSSFNHFHGSKSEYYTAKTRILKDFKIKHKKLVKKGKKAKVLKKLADK